VADDVHHFENGRFVAAPGHGHGHEDQDSTQGHGGQGFPAKETAGG